MSLAVLLWTSTACGPRFDACASDCEAYANLIEACLEEWRDEHGVSAVCYNGYSTTWYDDYGNLKSDNPEVMDAYEASGRDCQSGDDAYQSCLDRNAVQASVAADAGNTQARQEACEENAAAQTNTPATQAMNNLDCLGFLQAIGIDTETP